MKPAYAQDFYSRKRNSMAFGLRILLFAHLLLITFQIPLRSTVYDTTFVRDFFLIIILILNYEKRKITDFNIIFNNVN